MEIKRKALFTQFLIVLANVNKFSYSGEESRNLRKKGNVGKAFW